MSSRDEIVRFIYEVTGDKELAATAATMLKAGDAADTTSAEFDKFSTALKNAAAQSKLINDAVGQKAGLTDLKSQLAAAQAGLEQLRAEFTQTDTSSKALNRSFAAAEAQVAALTRQIAAEEVALLKTEGTLQKFGVDTANLATESVRVKQAANESAVALAGLGTATKETAAGFSEIAEKSTLLSRAVEQVKALIAAFAGLFVLEKAKDAIEGILEEGDKAARFGAQFAAAFGGVDAGTEALQKVREIAETVPLALDDVTAAALRAKKEGLDPFDGTLTALIDVNAKFGGSVETLNTLIDTLGKAANKGQIDLRALTTLQQQGIPAAKLLGDAMGKTADEILNLAKNGQLGKDAVKTLIDALAQSGSGEAAAQLGLLSGVTKKLHDDWQEFLELIANSGAYEFVQQQLQKLNTLIREGLADGSLAKAAQSISDAIVGIGKAVVGTTQFLVEHATAIGTAIKGYVLFRATLLALDLAGAAQRMLALGAATQAAGEAAAGAAEAGGFAKLTAAIGRIPKAIQIGITVAAVDFALTQIEDLITAGNEFYATQQKQKDLDKEISEQRESNFAKAATIAARLQQFADVQVESADELRTKNKQQTDAYIDQLQQATRFYTALRIQQEQAGDSAGVTETTAKLRELGLAAEAAGVHLKDLAGGLKVPSQAVADAVHQFDELKLAGANAAVAISGAFKDIDLRTPTGLQSTIDLIQKMGNVSRDAKQAVSDELVSALTALDAADLKDFQTKVTQRLNEAKGSADELKTALGAALQASLLQLGLSAEQAGVKVTSAGEKIIAEFDNVATNASASAQTIQLAFAKALSQASTEGEVQQLQADLTKAFNAGKIGADAFGVSMEAAGRKTAQIQTAAADAASGLDGVGKAGETAAQRISGSLQDARDKLVVQQNALSAQLTAALAANNTTLAASLNAQIKSVGITISSLSQQIGDLDNAKVDIDLTGFSEGVAPVLTGVHDVYDSLESLDGKAKESAGIFEELGGAAGAQGPLLDQLANDYSRFSAVSSAAVEKFSRTMVELFNGTGNFSQQALTDSTGIIKAGEAAAQAAQIVQTQIDQQRQGVADLAQQYNDLSDAELKAAVAGKGGFDNLADSLRGDAAAARDGHSAFTLLGQADLSPLVSALDSAASKVEQLKEQALEASDALKSIGDELADQIDELQGNQNDIENRRFQNQLDQIKAQAELAGTLNTEAYNKLVQQAKLLHELKLKQIADEQAAANKNSGNGNGGPDAPTPVPPGGPGGGDGQGGGGAAAPSVHTTVNVLLLSGDENSVNQVADLLTKRINNNIQQIARRSV